MSFININCGCYKNDLNHCFKFSSLFFSDAALNMFFSNALKINKSHRLLASKLLTYLYTQHYQSTVVKCDWVSTTDQTEVRCCSPAEGSPEVQQSHLPGSWPGMRWKATEAGRGFPGLLATEVHTRLPQHRITKTNETWAQLTIIGYIWTASNRFSD